MKQLWQTERGWETRGGVSRTNILLRKVNPVYPAAVWGTAKGQFPKEEIAQPYAMM
jgi:hypothetical protein